MYGFHEFSQEMGGRDASVAEALDLDAARRLTCTLRRACEQRMGLGENGSVSQEAVVALVEVLLFWKILVADKSPLLPAATTVSISRL